MFYEMLHSFGHLVVSCCIMLYHVVSCCIKFDRYQTFSLNKCCTIQHFFSFVGCCMMLYNVVLVWPPHVTLLYSALLARGQWKQFSRHILLLTGRREITKLFSLQTSSVVFLQSAPWLCFLNVFNLCPFASFTIFY